MNFFKYFIMLALLFTVGCASQETVDSDTLSASDQSEDVTANTDSDYDPDEMICRREQVTGTNFRRRVCLTRAQRDGMRNESREEFIERRSGTLGAAAGAPAQ